MHGLVYSDQHYYPELPNPRCQWLHLCQCGKFQCFQLFKFLQLDSQRFVWWSKVQWKQPLFAGEIFINWRQGLYSIYYYIHRHILLPIQKIIRFLSFLLQQTLFVIQLIFSSWTIRLFMNADWVSWNLTKYSSYALK